MMDKIDMMGVIGKIDITNVIIISRWVKKIITISIFQLVLWFL